ncbi:MAG: CRISPR-associated endonuclease Cas1, partial [Bacillota bacterium]|nr:CRISPR-associated endonuclease Cas1 [Bacillota bacterium]
AHPAVSSGSDPSLSAQEPASGPADPTSPSGSDPSPAVQDPAAEPLPDPAGRALIDQLRPVFLSIEGRASKVYWDAVQWLTEGKVAFEGREHRGATDPVNVMLNYGYGMLYSQIWTAVLLAGLEPFAGFLHVDRPGKPSLVLDLIEEFRQHVVDRAVIAAVNKGFTVDLAEGKLTDESRRALAEKILERLEARELFEGQRLALRAIIQRQARRLASYLRGEGAYRPFVGGW